MVSLFREILKDRYAENFFNKLILQTFKGWLLDEWKSDLDLNPAHEVVNYIVAAASCV